MICIFTRYIHGESGTELPPPIKETKTYVHVRRVGEPPAAFRARMQELGMRLRRTADAQPKRPYSERDGWDWRWVEPRPVPGEEAEA